MAVHDPTRPDRDDLNPRHAGPRFGYKEDERSPERIHSNIRRTRSAIDETLDELGAQLQPRRIAGDVADWVGEQFPDRADIGRSLQRTARSISRRAADHPIPAALVGVGLIWLLSEEASGHSVSTDRIREGASGVASRARAATPDASGRTAAGSHGMTDEARQRARRGVDRLSEAGHQALNTTSQQARHAARATGDAFERNPLAFGLAVMAGGLLAGLAAPNTRREHEAFGAAGDRIRDRARDAGEEALQDTAHAARSATETARDRAHDELDRREQAQEKDEPSGTTTTHASPGRPPSPGL